MKFESMDQSGSKVPLIHRSKQADSETSIKYEVPYWSELEALHFIHRSTTDNGEERHNDVCTLVKNTGRN